MNSKLSSCSGGLLLLASLSFGPLSACSGQARQPTLVVAAASSLAPVFSQLGPEFAEENGIEVTFVFASTGHLEQQMRNGAPFDIFAAADTSSVDRLIDQGLLSQASRAVFARGTLVLAQRAGPGAQTLADLLTQGDGRLAIASPKHAPYGIAARQALENTALWEIAQPRMVYAESVRQATQFIETGNAAAGLVSKTTALAAGLMITEVDPHLYQPILHAAAIAEDSPMAQQAGQFLRFLVSPAGASILEEYGLEPMNGP